MYFPPRFVFGVFFNTKQRCISYGWNYTLSDCTRPLCKLYENSSMYMWYTFVSHKIVTPDASHDSIGSDAHYSESPNFLDILTTFEHEYVRWVIW